MSIMEFISEIIDYGFVQKALFTSVMVGIICGIVGCFIVLRGLALMGDAISHAVLPGVAISFLLDINFFYGAVVAGILTALGIGYVNQNSRIKSDSSIGIVFTAFLALGVLLIRYANSGVDLDSILFGSLTSVQTSDMWMTLIVGAIVLLVVVLFYKELLISTFDPTMAAAYGLPTKLIHYMLMILLTLVTVASMQTVGVVLVVALLITPASTAYLLTNRLWVMLILSASFGVISSLAGLYFSFAYDLDSGAVIVLTSFVLFAFIFFFSPKQGVLWRAIRSKRKRNAAN
ncbi:metal ABC transporter permease [Oceanobacillus neutriphilus]|uniref:Manganese transport system membrane protein MntC n=1 Tax=Oceanobacillus neutriphilus TaxID=531815 RepID=A0ABQ2NUH1_9BACI|nr:metal ABC transporter permease [Oceanobacillus neutriphilus]GGP10836.1 manganese transport system membrane protein MntC [Oceanobacillus neutriphilus]